MVIQFPKEYEWVVSIREISPHGKLSLIHLLYCATEIASDGSLVCRDKAVDILMQVFGNQLPCRKVINELSHLGIVRVVGNLTFIYLDKIRQLYDLYNTKEDVRVDDTKKEKDNVEGTSEDSNEYMEKVKEILRNKDFLKNKKQNNPIVEKLVTTLRDRSRNFYTKLVECVSVNWEEVTLW